jgi:hypothetical protein
MKHEKSGSDEGCKDVQKSSTACWGAEPVFSTVFLIPYESLSYALEENISVIRYVVSW